MVTLDPQGDLRARTRASVAGLFLLLGVSVGGWLSRVPDVKAQLSLDDAQWGTTVVASTVGSFLALFVVAAVLARVGPLRLVRLAAPLLLVVTPLLALAPGRVPLMALLVLFGASTSTLNTPMNAQAVAVERSYGRPVMSSFHACYSVGTLAGALLGSAAASTGVAPGLQLAATSALLAAVLVAAGRGLPGDPPPLSAGEPSRPSFSGALGVLAVLGLCAALAEGTTWGWSAIYVAQTLHAPHGLAAFAYACFAGAMTLGRLAGDRVVARLGRARFLTASGALAATGLGLGLASGTAPGACVGFALLGIGLSCVVPTVYGAAGAQQGVSAAVGVTTVTVASWPAFLVGPPVVGWLSSQVGLRGALLLVVAAVTAVAVLGRRVRTASTAPHSLAH
jgi:fucose permease